MIFYWKSKNHAAYYKLGRSIRGLTFEDQRPDVVILTKEEYDIVTTKFDDKDLVTAKRNVDYYHVLLRITQKPNVIVATGDHYIRKVGRDKNVATREVKRTN